MPGVGKTPYAKLYSAYQKAYAHSHTKAKIQEMCNTEWATLKSLPGPELLAAVDERVSKLLSQATRKSAGLFNFFAQVCRIVIP